MQSKVNWKDEQYIRHIISISIGQTDALRKLGISPYGHNFKTLQSYVKKYEISIDHFEPQYARAVALGIESAIPLQDILDGNHPQYRTYDLKRRLINAGIKINECEECGQDGVWNSQQLKMQLDHIDGNSSNHILSNLKMLCPNCHTQTPTYAGKNTKKAGTGKYQQQYNNRKEYVSAVRKLYETEQQVYIPLILESGIDFSKFGWGTKVSKIINQRPQKVGIWMKRMMPEFYEQNCFKRKSTK